MKQASHSLGIDMSADTFTVCVSMKPGEALHGPELFDNTPDGFKTLHEWMNVCELSTSSLVICLESTGVYGEALCYYLVDKGYQVSVEHPLKVKRAFDVDGHKTDAVDSIQIAEYALRFQDELELWQPKEKIVEQIHVLLSTREQLVGQRTRCKNSLHALSRKVIKSKVAVKVLEKNIKSLSKDILAMDREIDRLIDQDPPTRQLTDDLKKAPGVGMLLTANLMVFSNGFQRDMNPRQLASYLKICPFKHESGTSVYRNPRAKKYGPARMRKLLHLAARSVVTHQPEFREYYLRKLAEGKPKKLVLNNVANKLVKILCAMIRDRKPYIKGHQSINPRLLKSA